MHKFSNRIQFWEDELAAAQDMHTRRANKATYKMVDHCKRRLRREVNQAATKIEKVLERAQ